MKPTNGGFPSTLWPAWGKLLAVLSAVTTLSLTAQYGFGQTINEPLQVESVSIVGLRSLSQRTLISTGKSTSVCP